VATLPLLIYTTQITTLLGETLIQASKSDFHRSGCSINDDPFSTDWIKLIIILERATKLIFLVPEHISEHALHGSTTALPAGHSLTAGMSGSTAPPVHDPSASPTTNSPRYRTPRAFAEVSLAVHSVTMGIQQDGQDPISRIESANSNGLPLPFISSHDIMLVSDIGARDFGWLVWASTIQGPDEEDGLMLICSALYNSDHPHVPARHRYHRRGQHRSP
jgi:hypothetical protein